MAATYYYTVDSEIIGEHTGGQSRIDYLTDALGSVVTSVDQTKTVTSTARFKPYGSDLATTGNVPLNGWNGKSGYRRTGRPHTEAYVRSRNMSSRCGCWISPDPLWPKYQIYGYALSNPTTYFDWTGLATCTDSDCCAKERQKDLSENACKGKGGWQSFSEGEGSSSWSAKCISQGSCASIRASLLYALQQCKKMCDPKDSGYDASEFSDATDYALTSCCDGKVCGIYYCPPLQGSLDPCAMDCLLTHEVQHTHQGQCGGPNSPPPGTKHPAAWKECDAYAAQANCLVLKAQAKNCSFLSDSDLGFQKAFDECKRRRKGVG
jgi:RHS repeat-associated protein